MKKNVFLKGIVLFGAIGDLLCLLGTKRKSIGKITDGKGEALAGVSVVVKGTTKGTSSDANGMYAIEAMPAQTLVSSFVGFKPQEAEQPNPSLYVWRKMLKTWTKWW